MAIDFPNSPATNDTFTVSGKTWIWTGSVWNTVTSSTIQGPTGATGAQGTAGSNGAQGIAGAPAITYSETAPSSPVVGDMWVDSNTGIEYVYVNDGTSSQWVNLSSPGYQTIQGTNGLQGIQGLQGTTALSYTDYAFLSVNYK
jgi:hypothetical protein